MAIPFVLKFRKTRESRRPKARKSFQRPAWLWFPRTRLTINIAGGGFLIGGGIPAHQPTVVFARTGIGGMLLGGHFPFHISLHPAVGGGFTMGGTATPTFTSRANVWEYREVITRVPSVNPDDVVVHVPLEPS